MFDPGAPMIDPEMLSMGVPVLGICYGLQLMMYLLGGQCCKADTREYGKTELTHTASPLFDGVPETAVYWMSHGVEVERLAPGFEIIASTEGCRHAAGPVPGKEALRRAVPPGGGAYRVWPPNSGELSV